MDDLLSRCIAHIQAIIDQLYTDLDAILPDADTASIRDAIQRMEEILHQYKK